MNITFSASTIAGYAVSGLFMLLLPVTVFIIWRKRTHEKLFPTLVGAVIFPVFALGLKLIPAYPLLYGDNSVSRSINAAPWLYYLTAGLLAGIFEETGRFLAFRYVLKKYTDRRTSVSYAIGHGGIEALYVGFTTLSFIVLAVIVNSGGIDEVTKDVPAELMPVAMDKLREYASMTFGGAVLGMVERVSAMMLQTGLSVLVFRAVREKKALWLYPLAIALHAAIDFSCIIYTKNHLLFEAVLLLGAAALLFITVRFVYRKMPTEKEVSV